MVIQIFIQIQFSGIHVDILEILLTIYSINIKHLIKVVVLVLLLFIILMSYMAITSTSSSLVGQLKYTM